MGDRVDVLLEDNGQSETLLERVLVLTVGQSLKRDDESKPTAVRTGDGVTLSVTQEQANELFSASSRGKLALVLRNPDDETQRVAASKALPSEPRAHLVVHAERKEIEHVR